MALTEKITAVADAIRSKTGGAEKLTLEQMAQAVGGISTGGVPEGAVLTGFRMRECADGNISRYPEPASEPYLSTNAPTAYWAYVAVPCPYDLSFFYEFRFDVGKDAAGGSNSSAQLVQLSGVNRIGADGTVTALPALPFTLGNSLATNESRTYGYMPILNPSLPTGCAMFTANPFHAAMVADYTDYSTTPMDYGCFAACAGPDGTLSLYPAGSPSLYTWKPGVEAWETVAVPAGMVVAGHKRLAKSNADNVRYMLFADDQGMLFMFRGNHVDTYYSSSASFPQVSSAYCWVYDVAEKRTVTAGSANASLASAGDTRTTCVPSIISLGLDGRVRFGLHDTSKSSCNGTYSEYSYQGVKNTCVYDKAKGAFSFEVDGSDTDAFRMNDRAYRLGPLHWQSSPGVFYSLRSTNFTGFREWVDCAVTDQRSLANSSGSVAGYYYPLVSGFMLRTDATGSADTGTNVRYANDHAAFGGYADAVYNGLASGMLVRSDVSLEGSTPQVKNTVYKTSYDGSGVVTRLWNNISSTKNANKFDGLNYFGASISFSPTSQMCFNTGYDGDSMYYVCQREMPPVFLHSEEHGMLLGGFYGANQYPSIHGVSMTLYKMEPVWGQPDYDIRMHPSPYSVPGYPHSAQEAARALPKIVSWADGTDEEVRAMVEAADRGLIKLRDYWHIGDTRKVRLAACNGAGSGVTHAAQDIELVLADDLPLMRLSSPVECGRKRPEFIVMQLDCLAETDIFATGNGGWRESELRTWCNGTYINALPQTLAPVFKEVVRVTPSSYSGYSTVGIATSDRAFIPTAAELSGKYGLFGSDDATVGAYRELRRFACLNGEYAVDTRKKRGTSGSYTSYHTANASGGYAYIVGSNGAVSTSSIIRQNYSYGIAPCLCI